ncbi:unnamed protein product [Durusdinium trenchii]|uniref:RNA-binding S4 domain-containing protein n=1 Tax=Durusdinium trenchii TaxID=1381693 RepID=A0ABP0KLI6_9DINO
MRNKKDLVKGTSHRLQAQLVIGICNGQHPACIVQIPYDARIVFKTILTFLCTMAINYVKASHLGPTGPDWTPVTLSGAQRSQPSSLARPQSNLRHATAATTAGALIGLALSSASRSSSSKVQLAATGRRRRNSPRGPVDPLEHLTPRAEDLEPGERLFRQVYRPSMRKADMPEEDGEEQGYEEEELILPKKRRGKAGWLAANQERKSDPAYGKKWVLDPNKRGPKKKRWVVGEVIDESQDIDRNASRLRTMYKRPRFSWKEAKKDDLRTETLSGKMSVIGNDEVWISKFLSHSGVCSRRDVKELVLQGRVTVNGEVIKDPVTKVDPKKDTITVDGKEQRLRTLDEIIWVMVYKPKDVLSTMEDPQGRKCLTDLVPFAKNRRLVPIGRLERNSTGIMFLTNDYEWHTVLAHPRYETPRRYRVVVYNGAPDTQRLQALQKGLRLPDEGRPCLPLEELEVLEHDRNTGIATLSFIMKEGRYRQILRMFEYIGHPIRAVKRTQFGLVGLDKELKAGEYRMLTPKEIRRLKGATILKKPGRGPVERARKMEKVFSGSDTEFAELESPSRRRRGRQAPGRRMEARDGPRGRRNEDLEPQVASLEGLKALGSSFESDMDSLEEDWETGWGGFRSLH